MRLGIATKDDLLRDSEALYKAGFDYIELSMMAVCAMSDKEFRLFRDRYANCPLRAEIFQSMLPGEYRLTGENVDLTPVSDYLGKAAERASSLGCALAVFGSAAARSCPHGFSKKIAFGQLIRFVDMAADIFAEYGIKLGIEQIAPFETNMINTLGDAEKLVSSSGRENVGIVTDLAHMALAGIGAGAVTSLCQPPLHAHIANPNGRLEPLENDGYEVLYREYINALSKKGYTATLSIETGANHGAARENIAAAGKYLKSLIE